MNKNTKNLIKFLKSDGRLFRLNDLICQNQGNCKIALEKLLAEMPITFQKSTTHYVINAYVDLENEAINYGGWSVLGLPDVDRYILNNRAIDIKWHKPWMGKIDHPEYFDRYRYMESVSNQNITINLYTL